MVFTGQNGRIWAVLELTWGAGAVIRNRILPLNPIETIKSPRADYTVEELQFKSDLSISQIHAGNRRRAVPIHGPNADVQSAATRVRSTERRRRRDGPAGPADLAGRGGRHAGIQRRLGSVSSRRKMATRRNRALSLQHPPHDSTLPRRWSGPDPG